MATEQDDNALSGIGSGAQEAVNVDSAQCTNCGQRLTTSTEEASHTEPCSSCSLSPAFGTYEPWRFPVTAKNKLCQCPECGPLLDHITGEPRIDRPSATSFTNFRFLDLPPEIRGNIYEKYLEADVRMAMSNEEFRNHVDDDDKWYATRHPCFYMPWEAYKEMPRTTEEDSSEEEDGSEEEEEGDEWYMYPYDREWTPALWSVSRQVRAESRDVHFNQRLLLSLQLQGEGRDSGDDGAYGYFEDWIAGTRDESLRLIRKIHVIVPCELWATNRDFGSKVLATPGVAQCDRTKFCGCPFTRPRGFFVDSDALFKLELLDDDKQLVIRTFCRVVDFQERNLREAIEHWMSSRSTCEVFTGLDLLDIVRVLKALELFFDGVSVASSTELHHCLNNAFIPAKPCYPFGDARTWILDATKENTELVEYPKGFNFTVEDSMSFYQENEVVKGDGPYKAYRLRSGYDVQRQDWYTHGGVRYNHVVARILASDCGSRNEDGSDEVDGLLLGVTKVDVNAI